MKNLNKTVLAFKESIFATLTKMSAQNQAINLAQGFPDFDGPQFLTKLIAKYSQGPQNQYAPLEGILPLREKLSDIYKNFYNLDYDAKEEITITHGATEAIYCTITALTNPGDEVIVFEPFYDSYLASIKLAGATPVAVTLHAPEFQFDEGELKNAISQKTKLIILNNPHNPSGRVFSKKELEIISKVAIENDCYVLSDEVYEYLTFDSHKHIPVASIDQMKDKTVTISSMGKTFGLTGWKTGWACAPHFLTHAIRMVHQFTTFCTHHPTQMALCEGLDHIDNYIPTFQKTYQEKRDYFTKELQNLGFNPFISQGTYFSMCPIPQEMKMNDIQFCEYLIKNYKVATIPPSCFYQKSKDGEKYLRFCFAKKEETLKEAFNNLSSALK